MTPPTSGCSARDAQLPLPDLDWCWLFLGGRGAGKSHSMSGAVHTAVPAGMSQYDAGVAPLCVAARSSLECGRSQLLLSLRRRGSSFRTSVSLRPVQNQLRRSADYCGLLASAEQQSGCSLQMTKLKAASA